MNKELQDKYILDYLEGNLSLSEQNLFMELVRSDPSFKAEYLKWRPFFFQKEQAIIPLKDKMALKKSWHQEPLVPIILLLFISIGSIGSWYFYANNDETLFRSKPESNLKNKRVKNETNHTVDIQAFEQNENINKTTFKKPNSKTLIPSYTEQFAKNTPSNNLVIIDSTTIYDSLQVEETVLNNTEIIILDSCMYSSSDTDSTSLSNLDTTPLENQKKQTKIKRSRYARKILRKENRQNFKKDIPKRDDLKEMFKGQSVIPTD